MGFKRRSAKRSPSYYDLVVFNCPDCHQALISRTKAGDCVQAAYRAECVPASISEALADREVTCESCQTTSTIRRVSLRGNVKLVLGQ